MFLRNINFFLMFWIMFSEIISIALNLILIKLTSDLLGNDRFKMENEIAYILFIIQEFFSLIYILKFGIHSLYFKIYQKLFWYIIISVFTIVFYSAIWFTMYIYELSIEIIECSELKDLLHLREFLILIFLIKSLCYLTSIFITIKERIILLKEVKESPFKVVDEDLTEEMLD